MLLKKNRLSDIFFLLYSNFVKKKKRLVMLKKIYISIDQLSIWPIKPTNSRDQFQRLRVEVHTNLYTVLHINLEKL